MPDTKLSPEGFRTAATALRARPVKNSHRYTEPVDADPSDPDCRVCFRAALAVGFPPERTREDYYTWSAAMRAAEAKVRRGNLTQALEFYGPEFCAQICDDIANEMENPHV